MSVSSTKTLQIEQLIDNGKKPIYRPFVFVDIYPVLIDKHHLLPISYAAKIAAFVFDERTGNIVTDKQTMEDR